MELAKGLPGYFNPESKINLRIATPCYGSINSGYHESLLNLSIMLTQCKISFSIHTLVGNSLIPLARNIMVAHFLDDPNLTHFLWIDSDLEFNPEIIVEMFSANKPALTAIYPHKILNFQRLKEEFKTNETDTAKLFSRSLTYPICVDAENSTETPIYQDKFIKVKGGTIGFMLLQRVVFDELQKNYPELKQDPGESIAENIRENYWGFFDTMVVDNKFIGEDVAFYNRLHKIGGEVYALLNAPLSHNGSFQYKGNLQDFLNN